MVWRWQSPSAMNPFMLTDISSTNSGFEKDSTTPAFNDIGHEDKEILKRNPELWD
ncbi:hypothetical protein KIN20_005590 [Parelaphostrongylus tenuis]|uniref:Uncharacterized protein n=1 Tax=Parelaphostrongylus tenuis TaxID=148309 RepID=A0AAD5M3H4_PARTN|nr:hypothetical protein KIN20_005590 [Parelaphostrongylus tenuis]